MRKILFIPNWHVNFMSQDKECFQAPDKYVYGQPYWFFKYFKNTEVDIIDIQSESIFHSFERKYLKNYIYQSWKAFRIRKNYDVVISHGAQSGLFYSLLILIFRSKNNPLHVIFDIGGLNGSRINKFETPLIRLALKPKPTIIYHAKSQIELYKQAYPELVDNTQFIRFGVDADYFRPKDAKIENFILSFGFSKRDYNTLIEAWAKVKTDTKLKIIGLNGISTDRIEYPGKVNIVQLKEEISKCLFVVIPLPIFNYSYGQMSFLQSMAMGKPVIVTKTPSSADYIKEGLGTYFVKPYDIDDLAYKIQMLLSEKDNLIELGLLAKKQIDIQLNEKIMAEEIHSFIDKLLISYEDTSNK